MKKFLAKIITRIFGPFAWFGLWELIIYFLENKTIMEWRVLILIILVSILPILFMTISIKLGHIEDIDISNRKERTIFFIFMIIIFLITSLLLKSSNNLTKLNLTIAMGWMIVTIITLFWKISAHLYFDTLMILGLATFNSTFYYALLLLPLVAYTRIFLKKHTLLQTISGFSLASIQFYLLWYLIL